MIQGPQHALTLTTLPDLSAIVVWDSDIFIFCCISGLSFVFIFLLHGVHPLEISVSESILVVNPLSSCLHKMP